jgi:hypothetical protein
LSEKERRKTGVVKASKRKMIASMLLMDGAGMARKAADKWVVEERLLLFGEPRAGGDGAGMVG